MGKEPTIFIWTTTPQKGGGVKKMNDNKSQISIQPSEIKPIWKISAVDPQRCERLAHPLFIRQSKWLCNFF